VHGADRHIARHEAGDTQAIDNVERNHLRSYMVLIGRFISGQQQMS
jgi:hypothetical protein